MAANIACDHASINADGTILEGQGTFACSDSERDEKKNEQEKFSVRLQSKILRETKKVSSCNFSILKGQQLTESLRSYVALLYQFVT